MGFFSMSIGARAAGGVGSAFHHSGSWMLATGIALAALGACSGGNGASAGDQSDAGGGSPDGEAASPTRQPTREGEDGLDGGPPILTAPGSSATDCATDGGTEVPDDLACTGLFADVAAGTLEGGVRAYTPGLTFWSDGAQKSRWVYLPKGKVIDTSDMDGWVFPEGTKFWKEFRLDGQRVETRLYWKRGDKDWVATTYRWSANGSKATRLRDGETHVNGTNYEIPNESLCTTCHFGRKDRILGFEAVGLALDAASGVTLQNLVEEGLLSAPPGKTTLTLPEDATGKAAQAAGWLHANCGTSCHNRTPNALAHFIGLWMRLEAKTLLAAGVANDGGAPAVATVEDLDIFTTAVNKKVQLDPYVADAKWKRITPGSPGKSLLYFLASTPRGSGEESMPPIVIHTPDAKGLEGVAAWITALGNGNGGADGGAEAGADGGTK